MDRNLKRPFPTDDDDDESKPPSEKRPRFPKGKKVKTTADAAVTSKPDELDYADPIAAAKERAKKRLGVRDEAFDNNVTVGEIDEDVTGFEEDYEFALEPFNLKQEREEGYFDASGNFVEFVGGDEIKDAWMDNVDVDLSFAEKLKPVPEVVEEEAKDLSSEDVGKIKRRIANSLEPGETIIRALRRLKGSSGDNKGKMNEMTKQMFDQLTEDAMKLMGNGEYDVYEEEHETFLREAEGYERLARAKDGILENEDTEDIFSDAMEHRAALPSIWDDTLGISEANLLSLEVPPSDDGEELDMFGGEEGNADKKLQSDGNGVSSASTSEQFQTAPDTSDSGEAAGSELESDYVYDETTGYYYSSSLGYYYDPTSQLYCCATTGTWYSFDGSTGAYTEIPSVTPTVNCT